MHERADVTIVGAGAAGLTAAIWAARTDSDRRIVVLDGMAKLGAKILVSGGGRCNVTHDRVDERSFFGSSPNAVKKVLRRFDVARTIAFFQELGVELKREDTGKLFPVTDSARTVLQALLREADRLGVELKFPRRVQCIERKNDTFAVAGDWGTIETRKVVLATGGMSLPKTGSDGAGYGLAAALGHTPTPRRFPALVPLLLPPDHFLCELSGVAVPATVSVRLPSGKKLVAFTDSILCTHFGLSGPGILDISRHLAAARIDQPDAGLWINWLPNLTPDEIDSQLRSLRAMTPFGWLRSFLPERLARALCRAAGDLTDVPGHALTRTQRTALVATLTALPVPVGGDRGFAFAEVTAGGIPLTELHLSTMESRLCPGLYLCGEICDVDGQIGGYNFQWAWSSGYTVGVSV